MNALGQFDHLKKLMDEMDERSRAWRDHPDHVDAFVVTEATWRKLKIPTASSTSVPALNLLSSIPVYIEKTHADALARIIKLCEPGKRIKLLQEEDHVHATDRN